MTGSAQLLVVTVQIVPELTETGSASLVVPLVVPDAGSAWLTESGCTPDICLLCSVAARSSPNRAGMPKAVRLLAPLRRRVVGPPALTLANEFAFGTPVSNSNESGPGVRAVLGLSAGQ